ncbi:hypothetical protein ACIP9H_25650 [Streptomyces sp. NPDC088732]|uniref:hypothetical protein n=1 Tax=Streptomyces sp. NPDC088732 TaxID=3365879 RepID=UPI00382D79AE
MPVTASIVLTITVITFPALLAFPAFTTLLMWHTTVPTRRVARRAGIDPMR